jgi:cytoskeleton protein RodZ
MFVKNIMTQEKVEARDFFGMKAKRESMGMTLKDVFAQTRISVVNLQAIENGYFHALPVSIYAKNFIKTYAELLDLDSKPILAGYDAYWKNSRAKQPVKPEKEPKQEQKTVSERKDQYKKEDQISKKSSYKKIYTAGIIIIIIFIVVSVKFFGDQQPQSKVAVNQPPIMETAPSAAIFPAPQVASKQVTSQSLSQQPKSTIPVKASAELKVNAAIEKKEQNSDNYGDALVIKATEATWLKIKVDQNPPFQVILKPGEAIKRKGTVFAIDIGNAGGVVIKCNGKTIENLGKSGEVRHLQIP